MLRRRTMVLMAVLLSLVTLTGRGLAQEDTGPVLPLTPDPTLCAVEPRPRAEIEALWASLKPTPATAPSEEDAESEPFVEPEGTPADEAIVAEVTSVIIEVIRCNANGNDGLVDTTFLTEEHLRDNLTGMSREDFDAWYSENPEPLPAEQWLMVYAVRNVRMLDDGRVGVNPEIVVPGVGHFRDFLVFEQVDGRWLIDESHEDEDIYERE